MKRVRDEMGLTNVEIMVPFIRTLAQAEKVVGLLAENGLKRGENGLRLIMMCEVPSNAILADRFLEQPGPRLGHGIAGRRFQRA
jgi:pyruvate, water dikinase